MADEALGDVVEKESCGKDRAVLSKAQKATIERNRQKALLVREAKATKRAFANAER